jgi:hypothetical protein
VRLLALASLLVALAVSACEKPLRTGLPVTATNVWQERWRDAAGKDVPEHIVSTSAPECVDDAVILYVGWPLGTRVDTVDQARQYVRDPEGTLETVGPLDTEATLPAGAHNTGYHLGDLQLWLGRDVRNAAYLVEGKTVERWPRLTEPVGCV